MDVTLFKKISSFVGGLVLAMTISAPANAAWTQVQIPIQYSSSIASLRLCKTLLNAVPQYPSWQVRSELTRITSNVSSNTLIVRRFPGAQFAGFYTSFSFNGTDTARTTGYSVATQDDRFFPIVSFNGAPPYQFPELMASQIADC
jgi:hypothetical protein